MRDNLSLEMVYQSFWRDTPGTFEVHPYCVKVFKQRWYVVGYNTGKKQIRTYALDRIKNLRPTEKSFQISKIFDAELFFSDCFGIIADDETDAETVKIIVYGKQVSYIRALPLHHSQKEEESTSEHAVFSYYIKPTYDFLQELLSHGTEVEVLSPEWFRKEIASNIAEQYSTYWGT